MPLTPPPGWATLQDKARRTNDPAELASIIDEMNGVLAKYEEATGDHPRKPQPKKQQGRGNSTPNKKRG